MMLLSSSSFDTSLRSAWGRDLNDLARVADDRRQIRRRAGQQVDLAEEAVRALDGDDSVLVAIALHDQDHARLDQEEVVTGVALAEQDLARLDGPRPANRAQPEQHLVVEARERAVTIDRLPEASPERLRHQAFWTTNIASSA
jgi:hypothetical protein